MELNANLQQIVLEGLEFERQLIDSRIAVLRAAIETNKPVVGKAPPAPAFPEPETAPAKRRISAAGRKRMAAAQQKRWADKRADAAPEPAKPKAKRVLSPAARKRIAAATRKRWAEYRAANAGRAAAAGR